MLNNAKKYYEKATYVQKRKIIKILFLNIKINNKKELTVQIKPKLQTLFNPKMVELMGFEPMSWQDKKIHLLP